MVNGSLSEYFNGYILVRIESLNPEKIINHCSRLGIILKDIERVNYTTIVFKMKHSQYKTLKKAIYKTNSRTKILKRYGVRFTYKSLSRRKFFLLGSAVFLGLIIFFSSFIWSIEIQGNKKINSITISNTLRKAGLKVGMLKYNVNLRKIEEDVIRNIKEVSVIKINFNGTRANVEIVERTMPPKMIDRDIPTNIVASKEGIITKIFSYKGLPLVKIGDYVKPNQVLISGLLSETDNEINKPIHAMGIVKAKIWLEAIKEVDLNYKYEVRTGKFKTKIYFLIGDHKLYVKNNNINYRKYDKIENKNVINLIGFKIPIEKITECYFEKTDALRRLSLSEAIDLGTRDAAQIIKKSLPDNAKILDIKNSKISNNKSVKVRLLYILEENIGIEKEIK